MYSLNLDSDGRILSICVCLNNIEYDNVVKTLPDGNVYDYRYVNGKYVYDPLPVTEEPEEPSPEERISAIEDVLLELMGV